MTQSPTKTKKINLIISENMNFINDESAASFAQLKFLFCQQDMRISFVIIVKKDFISSLVFQILTCVLCFQILTQGRFT